MKDSSQFADELLFSHYGVTTFGSELGPYATTRLKEGDVLTEALKDLMRQAVLSHQGLHSVGQTSHYSIEQVEEILCEAIDQFLPHPHDIPPPSEAAKEVIQEAREKGDPLLILGGALGDLLLPPGSPEERAAEKRLKAAGFTLPG